MEFVVDDRRSVSGVERVDASLFYFEVQKM